MRLVEGVNYPTECPNCGGKKLIGGPRGGLSQNVLCQDCVTEWNFSPFGASQIIPARVELYSPDKIAVRAKEGLIFDIQAYDEVEIATALRVAMDYTDLVNILVTLEKMYGPRRGLHADFTEGDSNENG